MKRLAVMLPLVLMSCSDHERPQPPTAAESDQLNEADAMLDRLANEEGPEAEAPSPSDRSE